MVSLGHVSLDGSKFFANTSKHKAASYSHLKANEKKLKREIEKLLKKAEKCDEKEDKIYHNGKGYSIPDELKIKESRLEKIKKVKKELEKREKKKDPKGKIKDKKQISYADTQEGMMKRRGNYEYCYNGKISVDSKNQIIVGQHLTKNANDKAELDRALTEIEKNTSKLPDKMSLDNGYATADNISTLSAAKIDAYIAAAKGGKDKSVDSSKKISKSYFLYNYEKDTFTCPAGNILELKYSEKNRIYRQKTELALDAGKKDRTLYSKNNTPKLITNRKGLLITL